LTGRPPHTVSFWFIIRNVTEGDVPLATLGALWQVRACVVMCCGVLLRSACYSRRDVAGRHCNTLQHSATYCDTLQHTTTRCNTLHLSECGLRGRAAYYSGLALVGEGVDCSVLQCVAVCCSALQYVVVYCSVCSVLQCVIIRNIIEGTPPATLGALGLVCCSVLLCVAVCCSVLLGKWPKVTCRLLL